MATKLDKAGRVHKKRAKYQPDFCEMLTEHMAQGKTIASFALMLFEKHQIVVSRKSIYKWFDEIEEFLEAKESGQFLSEGYWDNKLQDGIGGGVLNAALCSLIMVNRHNWRTKAKDEVETVVNNTNNFSPEKLTQEELDAQLATKIAAHLKQKGQP